jgi:hypothetical protein
VFPGYQNQDISRGHNFTVQGLTAEQRERIGDFVIHDLNSGEFKAITREDVGDKLAAKGLDPALTWTGKVTLVDGSEGTPRVTPPPGFQAGHQRRPGLRAVGPFASPLAPAQQFGSRAQASRPRRVPGPKMPSIAPE